MIISNHKSRAVVEVSRSQPDKPVTWEEIQRDMKSLVGMEPVKEQLLQIARTLTNIKDHQERHGLKLPPLHFLVEDLREAARSVLPRFWVNYCATMGWQRDPYMWSRRKTSMSCRKCLPHRPSTSRSFPD